MRVCSVCGDNFKVMKFGGDGEYHGIDLCNKHYLQVKRKGKIIDTTKSRRNDLRTCDVCNSDVKIKELKTGNQYHGMLFCCKHYSQARNGKITDTSPSPNGIPRICSICSSTERVIYREGKMYCRKHYDHVYLYGEALKRSKYDKNEVELYDNYALIYMYNFKHEKIAQAIVDLEDVEFLSNYKWSLGTHGYARTRLHSRKYIDMHRLLLSNDWEIVDHKNRDKLDNRKENLVQSNKSKNAINAGLRTNNKSGVTGVSFNKTISQWRAYISVEGKRIELGHFTTKEEAIISRLNSEKLYYNENPPQQQLFKEYNIK